MPGWLKTWGEPAMMSAGHSMGTMMSGDDTAKLDASQGTEAAKMFLSQMVQHHRGAVTMAKDELGKGSSKDALALAQSIVTSQEAQIKTMNDLLATL